MDDVFFQRELVFRQQGKVDEFSVKRQDFFVDNFVIFHKGKKAFIKMAGGEDNNQQPRQPRDMQVSQSCSQEIK